jgi:hypothetical protein
MLCWTATRLGAVVSAAAEGNGFGLWSSSVCVAAVVVQRPPTAPTQRGERGVATGTFKGVAASAGHSSDRMDAERLLWPTLVAGDTYPLQHSMRW